MLHVYCVFHYNAWICVVSILHLLLWTWILSHGVSIFEVYLKGGKKYTRSILLVATLQSILYGYYLQYTLTTVAIDFKSTFFRKLGGGGTE